MPKKHPQRSTGSAIVKAFGALLVALACLPHRTLAAEPPVVRIVSEEFPPYNMTENGRFTGFSTEVVEAVLNEIGMQAGIQSMPWARAYELALNAENVLIYSILRTPAREALFQWVGALAPSDWSLFALKDSGIALNGLDDARKYKIATVNEDAGEQFLVARGFEMGRQLQSSTRYEHNFEKLMLKRVDLWVENELLARHIVRRSGRDPDQVLEKVLPLPEMGNMTYMAFSRGTPKDVVDRFRSGFDAIRKNGKFDALKKKWL